jgi:hypothetical protein
MISSASYLGQLKMPYLRAIYRIEAATSEVGTCIKSYE